MKDLKHVLSDPNITDEFLSRPDILQTHNPHGFYRIQLLHDLFTAVQSSSDQRDIIAQHLAIGAGERIASSQLYETLEDAIRFSRDFLDSLVHEFLPDSLRYPFTSDGVVAPTSDPAEILRMIWNPPGSHEYSSLRAFKARVLWHLGMRALFMNTLASQPLASQLRDLTLWFEEKLFSKNHEHPREDVIRRFCDPADRHRYCERQTACCVEHLVSHRYIDCGPLGHIPVLYDGRIKSQFSLLRKVLLQGTGEIPIVRDYCAITLVFMSKEAYETAVPILRKRVFPNSDAIMDLNLRGFGSQANGHSSDRYHPEEKFLAYVHGILTEVQIFLYPNWFNRKFSSGPENHHLYRLRQVLQLFRLFFPKNLYLIDWDDPNVRRTLRQVQLGLIKSSYSRVIVPSV